MSNSKIISITGDLGSGKSTVSNLLCQQLNYDYIYTGKIQREIALKYNMTTLELNKYSETHPEIDDEIDSVLKSLNTATNLIADSRLAWFFIPKSFKVFLKTNLIVSANRISNDNERKNEKYSSKEEAVNKIIARKTSENKRYMDLYGANCAKLNNYNLIIDTSFISPEKVADIIIAEYDLWVDSNECAKSFISPANLYPTKTIKDVENEHINSINSEKKANDYFEFPVIAVNFNSFDYIIDGHKKTSLAVKNNIDLISVVYKDENDWFSDEMTCKDKILSSINKSLFYEWEKYNLFNYLIYPQL